MTERELQEKINADLRKRGIKFIHLAKGRTFKQTSRTGGIPDLLIFPKNGLVLFVELKTEKGKLKPQQIEWQLWAKEKNYYFSVIRNYEQWELFTKVML